MYVYAGPPGNGTPSESQLLDAYYAEARRLIDAPDEVTNSNPVFVYPGVFPNFIRAYEQSVFSDDRNQKLNYAKAVCCLRLITVVKVGLQVFANIIRIVRPWLLSALLFTCNTTLCILIDVNVCTHTYTVEFIDIHSTFVLYRIISVLGIQCYTSQTMAIVISNWLHNNIYY